MKRSHGDRISDLTNALIEGIAKQEEELKEKERQLEERIRVREGELDKVVAERVEARSTKLNEERELFEKQKMEFKAYTESKDFRKREQALAEKETRIHQEINDRRKELSEVLEAFEVEKRAFEALAEKAQEQANAASDLVKLCVGGMSFVASRKSLLSTSPSFFSAMLGSKSWKPNFEEAYFIDRDPCHFPRILNYLRSGVWNTVGLTQAELEALQVELDFYQIGFPTIPDFAWDPNYKSSGIVICGNQVTGTGVWQGVLATSPLHSFKVRSVGGNKLMVGFAFRSKFRRRSENYSFSGYFLCLRSQTLFSLEGKQRDQYNDRPMVPVPENTVVEARFDNSRRKISFVIGDVDCGVAFSKIPIGEHLYPCIEIGDDTAEYVV